MIPDYSDLFLKIILYGKASIIWFSKEKEQNLLEGYRWNRFFKLLNNERGYLSYICLSCSNTLLHKTL